MKKLILILALALTLSGCATKAAAAPPPAGKNYEPPVRVESIPSGHWACVMNETVHYSSPSRGEGRCPVCNMKLVRVSR